MRAGAAQGAPLSACVRVRVPVVSLPCACPAIYYADTRQPACSLRPHACPHSCSHLPHVRRAQNCTPVCGRKIDAVTEEDLLLYVLLSSNLALGYSVIL